MNIGMILDSTFPPDPRVEREALSLINDGHSVFLYCFTYSDIEEKKETHNGIYVNRVKMPKLLNSISALAYTNKIYHYSCSKSINNFIKSNQIDIIHIHDMQIARAVFEVNKKYNLPIVLDLHENRPEIMKYYDHVKSFKGKILICPQKWKKYEYEYIKKADKVVVVTKEAKEYYKKEINIDANKIHVLPNLVSKRFYTKHTIKDEIINKYSNSFTLLYLGDTGYRRGIITAIKAVKLLIPRIPTIKLLIVGKSKSDETYIDMIKKLEIESFVDLVGWQDFKLFPSYIKASKIGISPLHKNIHHETTFANKIFQYLAFGLPIVVSDCLAQANIAREYNCGLVHKAQDEEDFCKKIILLYQDKEKYITFSKNGLNAIQKELNWENVSQEIQKIYSEI